MRTSTPILLPVTVLAIASLACALVRSARPPLPMIQADINSAQQLHCVQGMGRMERA